VSIELIFNNNSVLKDYLFFRDLQSLFKHGPEDVAKAWGETQPPSVSVEGTICRNKVGESDGIVLSGKSTVEFLEFTVGMYFSLFAEFVRRLSQRFKQVRVGGFFFRLLIYKKNLL